VMRLGALVGCAGVASAARPSLAIVSKAKAEERKTLVIEPIAFMK
jgi:hypothetical protein